METRDKTREPGWSTTRYGPLHRSGLGLWKLGLTTSNMEVDTHLGNKEVSTSAFVETEAVKEETIKTNTKAIERKQFGLNQF